LRARAGTCRATLGPAALDLLIFGFELTAGQAQAMPPDEAESIFQNQPHVIRSYDCLVSGGVRQNFMMPNAYSLPRRDFLKLAGAGAAALALPGSTFAGFFGNPGAPGFDTKQLAGTHDLPSLPFWGPYSKKHFGISHIPDLQRGLCFDWSIFPMLTKGPNKLPSVMDPCGVHPWAAAPDLEFYSLRQELIGKDQFYCDLSFSKLPDDSRLVRLELVNQTGEPQEITLNCLTQLAFPPVKELTAEPIRLCNVELPADGVWVHALDYDDLQFAKSRATDNLGADGKWRGEERRHDSVGGSVVAENFGKDAGDTVVYRVELKKKMADAVLTWRCAADKGAMASFQLTGAASGQIAFIGTGKFEILTVPLGKLKAGKHEFRFTSLGGSPVALNGFAMTESAQADKLHFVAAPWQPIPEIKPFGDFGVFLKYQDVTDPYGFALNVPLAGNRIVKWRDLDKTFSTESGPNTKARIFGDPKRGRTGDPDSVFVHAFTKPFTVAPNSREVMYGVVAHGTQPEVQRQLKDFSAATAQHHDAVYRTAQESAFRPASTPAGESNQLSQRLMAAVTLTNLVYPVYTQRHYIRHYSPGRSWDCLYTWDAGFIGLGLLELDTRHAAEILNTYLTAPGSQSAFIHHGSPVPVQLYLFHELWNRTQSRELLEYFYPRLQQYHRFLTGRLGSSTTRRRPDGLICTWDYFYNSGGWDDYAPQKYVHAKKLESTVTPVINSAQAIRCAKMLRLAAAALGRHRDFAEYDADISSLSAALQKYSWDEDSGYFGYVVHGADGAPSGILRTDDGVNFNMGIDGTYPLIAGICSDTQEKKILEHIFSPQHLWMAIGITTVDQSAPYFIPDGYWNGSVWLAHQWFIWKTMLDLGRADLAARIAQTGLKVWQRVTDASYDCMEHFMPNEPYGAGWHQFSSLSSPALSWFAALYTPGRLTCGFDVWIEKSDFSDGNRRLAARLQSVGQPDRPYTVLACMNPDAQYQVLWNRKPVTFSVLHEGLLQIQLPREAKTGELQVSPA
jgi:hypothetical protein